MKKIRIFLADDHEILREGLWHILSKIPEYEVIGDSGDGREALEKIEFLKPDIAIVDISMPTMNGIEVTRELKKYRPEIKIIILSQHNNEEYVKQLFKFGVDGYLLKENASDELLKAVNDVIAGNSYLSPEITKKVMSDYFEQGEAVSRKSNETQFSLLTDRERVILKMIAEGKSNKEIASILFISDQTVKTHRANIMKKLKINKLADLIKYAIKSGIVD